MTDEAAQCVKCELKTEDGVNAKTCDFKPQYLCVRCYVAHTHEHASCRKCFGLNGSTATWRMKKSPDRAHLRAVEAKAKEWSQ